MHIPTVSSPGRCLLQICPRERPRSYIKSPASTDADYRTLFAPPAFPPILPLHTPQALPSAIASTPVRLTGRPRLIMTVNVAPYLAFQKMTSNPPHNSSIHPRHHAANYPYPQSRHPRRSHSPAPTNHPPQTSRRQAPPPPPATVDEWNTELSQKLAKKYLMLVHTQKKKQAAAKNGAPLRPRCVSSFSFRPIRLALTEPGFPHFLCSSCVCFQNGNL